MRAIILRTRFLLVAAVLLVGAACSSAELPTQPELDLDRASSVAPTGLGTATEQTGDESAPPTEGRGHVVYPAGG